MGFLDRLFAPRIDEARLAHHRERAGEIASTIRSAAASLDPVERRRLRRRLPHTDEATLVSLAIVLADDLRSGGADSSDAMALLAVVARTPLPFTGDDLSLLVDLAAHGAGPVRRRILSVATSAAETLSARGSSSVPEASEQAMALLAGDRGQEAARLRSRLLVLVGGDDVMDRAALELLRSLREAQPTSVWLRRCAELVNGSEGRVTALVKTLLLSLEDAKPVPGGGLRPQNSDLLRAAVWAASVIDEPGIDGLLIDVYRRARALRVDKVTNAAIAVLGRRASAPALIELGSQWWSERRRDTRASIERALDAAAAELGVTRSTLLEPFVPRRPSRRVVAEERRRLEMVMAEDHGWQLPMWKVRYVEHPVTGPLGRTLVWTIDDGVHRSTGIPSDAAGAVSFRQTDDVVVTPPAEAVIRPWHPLLADDVEVRSWVVHLDRHRLEQAIEQVRRPVFRITGDEPSTHETYRFSERVVDLPTVRTELRRLGWTLGRPRPFRSWLSGERVETELHEERGRWGRVAAVRFSVPFAEVGPLVFSEALLDVARAIDRAAIRE